MKILNLESPNNVLLVIDYSDINTFSNFLDKVKYLSDEGYLYDGLSYVDLISESGDNIKKEIDYGKSGCCIYLRKVKIYKELYQEIFLMVKTNINQCVTDYSKFLKLVNCYKKLNPKKK